MHRRIAISFTFTTTLLFSQFYDVKISYDYNDNIIKENKTYILEEFNDKIHFPDANDRIVKQLNDAIKIRMKIIKAKKEREDLAG